MAVKNIGTTEPGDEKQAVAQGTDAAAATITMTHDELQALVAGMVQKTLSERGAGDPAIWLQDLTRQIGKMTTQGTGQPEPIEPHVIERRNNAKQRMIDLIVEMTHRCAAAPKDRSLLPLYRVLQEVHMDGRLIAPFMVSDDPKATKVPNDIFYAGIPNIRLFPMNDIARQIHDQMLIWCGDKQVVGHDPSERYYISRGRGDTMAMRLREAVVMASPAHNVSPFGADRIDTVLGVQSMSPAEAIADAQKIADYMRNMGLEPQDDETVTERNVLGTYMRPAEFSEPGARRRREIGAMLSREHLESSRLDIELSKNG